MNIKRNLTSLFFLLMALAMSLLLFVGCDTSKKSDDVPSGPSDPSDPGDHTHVFGVIKRQEPTCSVNGYEDRECKICGKLETITLPKTEEHTFSSTPFETIEPTCTENGENKFKCTGCDEVNVVILPATGHTSVPYEDVAPTCGTVGYQGGTYCSVCHAELTARTELPKAGEHTPVAYDDVAATCAAVGYEGGTYCSVCHEELTPRTEIAKVAHNYIVTVTVTPEFGKAGEKTYTCSVCSDSHTEVIPALTYRPEDVWDGTAATGFAGGTGTESDPYLISNAAEFCYFATKVTDYYNIYYKLTADIILNDLVSYETWSDTVAPTNTWTPIGCAKYNYHAFTGYFDGDGHSVRGMYIKATDASSVALFGTVESGSIKNLKVTEAFVVSQNGGAAGIIAYANPSDHTLLVENCSFDGTVVAAEYAGGIIAHAKLGWSNANYVKGHLQMVSHPATLNIIGCTVSGKISSVSAEDSSTLFAVGGILGYAPHDSSTVTITNCTNMADIDGTNYAGGILGYYPTTSENCQGGDTFTLQNVKNTGAVNGKLYAGGLVGCAYFGTKNSNYATVSKSSNSGDVTSERIAGGLFGNFEPTSNTTTKVTSCYNLGNICAKADESEETRRYTYAGGLFGKLSGASGRVTYLFSDSFNSGNVTADSYAGGYAGSVSTNIPMQTFYNEGKITATKGMAGGIFATGKNVSVTNCYNTGAVEGYTSAGGIAGKMESGTISYTFNMGKVKSATVYAGAVIGQNVSDVTCTKVVYLMNCAEDGEGNLQGQYGQSATGVAYNRGGILEAKFADASSFSGFNFTTVWQAASDEIPHPTLRTVVKIQTADTDTQE